MNKLPKLFFKVLIVICLVSIIFMIFKYGLISTIPMVLYFFWLLSESYVFKRDANHVSGKVDNSTVVVYGYGRVSHVFVTAIVFLFFTFRKSPDIQHLILGAALLIFGILIRKIAITTLGKHYSHLIDIKNDHQIVQSGIYKYIRHPAYTGMIIASLGLSIAYSSTSSFLFLFLVLVPSIMFRINFEEKALKEINGYKEYALKVKKFIPFIY
ncbi:isoprenylcysteine carboxylmethyltransferase family protein [Xenorhabdus sp. XENO-1]|uniref:methyltransferase family protein n=1 Tax=Xenorhabdus bovienii TaxID=40576 RepID=UPI0020CA6F02|nr:isoprenylcysteine carboxylmethyltransferase family protein [Xenorhabdus bovienii]MCP9266961.1 isoprenylcysteine carboxylmethyltransferase family protein [Xenorhabdus bovienii subsp. africana]